MPVGPAWAYPRYDSVRSEFELRYKTFCAFVRNEGLGDVEALQGEVSYVNLITAGDVWAGLGEVDRVMRTWRPRYAGQHLGRPEDVRILERHRMNDPHGSPPRLYISAVPAEPASDGAAQLLLTLTVKGMPQRSTDGLLEFFDFGREQIVKAFAATTTDAMHEVWGRVQ